MSKTRLAIIALATSMIALTGCSSDDGKGSTGHNQKVMKNKEKVRTHQVKEKPKKLSAADLKEALTKVDLGSADIGHDVSRKEHDDDLDAPTNDICGREGASDKNRIARDQGYFWAGDGAAPLVVSNEVVAYKPGTGEKVLSEVKQAVADCNEWQHDGGEMKNISFAEPPRGAMPDSFAWRGTDTRQGIDYHYTAVYQMHGDLLSIVYVWARDKGTLSEVLHKVVPAAAEKLDNAL